MGLVEDLEQATVRVDAIYHLPTMFANGNDVPVGSGLSDLILDNWNHPGEAFTAITQSYTNGNGEPPDFFARITGSEFMEECGYTLQGWIIEVSHPVMRRRRPDGPKYYSWGYLHVGIIWATTYEQCVYKAIEWVEQL